MKNEAVRKVRGEEADPARRPRLGVLDSLLGYHLRRAQVALFQHFAATVGAPTLPPDSSAFSP